MLTRRACFMTGAATAFAATTVRARAAQTAPDYIAEVESGFLHLYALDEAAIRVRFVPKGTALATPVSDTLLPRSKPLKFRRKVRGATTRLSLPKLACELDGETGLLRFFDRNNAPLLSESARSLTPAKLYDEPTHIARQSFDLAEDEYLYGTGCFQDGELNLRHLPRRLTQVNTQISLPFLLSSRGYGVLWHQTGMVELNVPEREVRLTRSETATTSETVNVTTATGNARVERNQAVFVAEIELEKDGQHAFLFDVGRKMASRHYLEIDGKAYADIANLWLPPTTGFTANLSAGKHQIRVIANAEDQPSLRFGPTSAHTVLRSDVSDAVDYVVIAGPEADSVMSAYRRISGETPILPKWAFGYIHCRERFKSSDEILDNAREFRARKLPVDVMVQDWQYWGKHGWNAMRFDEEHYPDPSALIKTLHDMDLRFMVSVWSKVDRKAELGKAMAARGFYIPDTEWIDFFNKKASDFYWENQKQGLADLGIDAWWQDATEPENDDLVGRQVAAGRGERVRLSYPIQVTRTVYEGQRRDYPQKRVFTLTRSAFPGQHRYAAATWSGDIGHNWETLKRQIPAGLNMAAAGYAYWTVDAGGFFRPGNGQYTDAAYHERFLRWFQYATFLPLLRVHGYMTDTEFWRYGETVESISREYLNLRYRLFPYIYSLAGAVNRKGGPMMRPLVFDFPDDRTALEQAHSYMFGPALHVAPVLAEGAKEWPVYLPQTDGGWFDLWSGDIRPGGREHTVPSPLNRIPVHVRGGSILPLGPVVQSTAEITGQDLDILVFPGRDATFELYEDQGLTYDYEKGASSRITLRWTEATQTFSVSPRRGQYDGMPAQRRFRVHKVIPGVSPLSPGEGRLLAYTGRALQVLRM